ARGAAVPASPPTPIQLAPLTIGMMALDGAREFQIRLDPAELGRVDVKLTIAEDGRVAASLVVDRVETLAMLQRDARTLERAFDQAGLN
ncbi:flagellar hook-length control protein FliK, partial [Bacillus velezensis]|uniref:flagellar hook-length control protein FliK n=1 Tax=Bacillus velezensis TaxID=492670 RepID=UPI003CF7C8B0